ncbi:MAG TPA: DUF6498-containing protein [bacterium]|nr:DUF6498-containing protein [bacterium]
MERTGASPWLPHWHPGALRDPSTLFLLAANLIPLLGVLFWSWDLFLLMMLYWSETAIIGFWHILRMALEAKIFALFLVPFFCVHFGGFMAGHFIFLMALFGKGRGIEVHSVKDYVDHILIGANLWIPFLALFLSHGISFFLNYLKPKMDQDFGLAPSSQRMDQDPVGMMSAPYRRVIVMHMTLLFGGFLSMALHMDKPAFFLMVALKTFVDLGAHTRKNFAGHPAADPA